MEQKTLNTLIDETLHYLKDLKIESPYVFSNLPSDELQGSKLPSTKTTNPETPRIKIPDVKTPTSLPQALSIIKEPIDTSNPIPKQPLTQKTNPIAPAVPIFTTHPPKALQKTPMEDLRSIISKIAPSLPLSHTIPDDTQAKQIKNRWKEQSNVPDIVILAVQGPSLSFLQQVAKAIELHFCSSRVIEVKPLEQQNSWEAFLNTPNLKMIITPDGVLWSCKHLMRYYHEFPNKKERFLGKIPLLLLPDPSLYLKDPTLKRSLWNLLCQMLTPPQH